mgnify:CR=1 FL=1
MSGLRRSGVAELPLHYGRAPPWLVSRMRKLASGIVTVIVDDFGQEELLRRIADPFWFQALGCVLGYDWHSSGVTTVLTGVLKMAIRPEEHGIAVAGGKGKVSLQAPAEIEESSKVFKFGGEQVRSLLYASRMSAKVDNTAVQAGYPLYHHAFFLARSGDWTVVQQGMSVGDRTARRYHWLSDQVRSFVEEPHTAIVCDTVRKRVLDMTARESDESRKISTDLAKDGPERVRRSVMSIRPRYQTTLREWIQTGKVGKDYAVQTLSMPWNINWEALKEAYERQPRNYEELLSIRGIGPATVRGLALVSEIIYGRPPSWRDPVKYSFCVGGKDGVPFPVNRATYDRIIDVMRDTIERAKMRDRDRLMSLQRLAALGSQTGL